MLAFLGSEAGGSPWGDSDLGLIALIAWCAFGIGCMIAGLTVWEDDD